MPAFRFSRSRALLLAGSVACVSVGGQARAQMESREAISLQNQILELRHEVEQGGGGASAAPSAPPIGGGQAPAGGDSSGLSAQLLDRVQTLEQQVRDMRGELDQLGNQVQQQNAALAKQIGDLSFAQQNGAGAAGAGAGAGAATAGAAAAAGAQQPAPAAPAPAAPTRRTPEATLAAGNAALGRRDYAAAQGAASEVLAGPRGPRQIDAQFLLGQSLAGQHQYQQAAVAYYDAYNRAPRSGRAPDALLGVGASMLALGDKPSACQALAKMHAEFPQPAPRVKAAYASLHARAACR